jgi:DNA-binding FadR family transcriptional regulator
MDVKREPIRKISLVDQIAMQLRQEIVSDKYNPGGSFPCEKDLTFRFGASRHTVRSALQKLAKEGLIEIEHGRSNVVKDYRSAIGIDVFPDLVMVSPNLITADVFSTYRQYIQWIHDQIILLAKEKARSSDKAGLLKIVALITDDLSIEDYWQLHNRFFRELLKITDNILLMMHYNSYINTQRRLLELGTLKLPAESPTNKQILFKKLVTSICSNNNKDKIDDIIQAMKASFDENLKKMLPVSRS